MTQRGTQAQSNCGRLAFEASPVARTAYSLDRRLTSAERIALRMMQERAPPTPKPITLRRFSWEGQQ